MVFGYAPPGIWGGEIAEHEQAIEELGEKVLAGARRAGRRARREIAEALVPKRAVAGPARCRRGTRRAMIVVGSFGEAPLKGIILGSTTNKLLYLTDRPVLVVPAEER